MSCAELTMMASRYVGGGKPASGAPSLPGVLHEPTESALVQAVVPCEQGTDVPVLDDLVRWTKASPRVLNAQGLHLVARSIWLDVDLPKIGRPARKRAWEDFDPDDASALWARARAFLTALGQGWLYRTRHGLRIVLRLPQAVSVGVSGQALEHLVRAVHALAAAAGVAPDPQCKDWTHLYALPSPGSPIDAIDAPASPALLSAITAALAAHPPDAELTAHADADYPSSAHHDLAQQLLTASADEPEHPPDLDLARGRLSSNLRAALARDLEPLSPHRNERLLKATEAAARSLANTPYLSPDYVYWILRDVALGFGMDDSAHKPYLAALPRLAATACARAAGDDRVLAALDYALTRPKDSSGPDTALGRGLAPDSHREHGDRSASPSESPAPGDPTGPPPSVSSAAEIDLGDLAHNVSRWYPPFAQGGTAKEALSLLMRDRRLMLTDPEGRRFWPLLRDGYYAARPVSLNVLPNVLTECGFPELVELTYQSKDRSAPKSVSSIVTEYCTVVFGERMVFGHDGAILLLDGEVPEVGTCPVRVNRDLTPAHDPDVALWLEHAFGDDLDEFLRSFLPLGRPQDGPTCIPIIIGPPGCGKNLLVSGIAEWFLPPMTADGGVLTSDYQDSMLRSCIIHVDEGLDRTTRNVADAIRRISNGGRVSINPKMRPRVEVEGIHRVVVTANNTGVVRYLVGTATLTEDDKRALAARTRLWRMREDAAVYLAGRGGRVFTDGWVADAPRRASDHRLARHLLAELHRLFEFDERDRLVLPPGRFIAEGRLSEELDELLEAPSDDLEGVFARGLAALFKTDTVRRLSSVVPTGVWVVTREVLQHYEAVVSNAQVSMVGLGRTIANLAIESRRPENIRRYFVPRSRVLARFAEFGIKLEGELAKAWAVTV